MTVPGRPTAEQCCACGTEVDVFLDLGSMPRSGAFPTPSDPSPDQLWPLRVGLCRRCHLVQIVGESPDEVELVGGPVPTASATMAAHARALVADVMARGLAAGGGRLVEVASHGGYLQPFFAEAGLPTVVLEADDRRAGAIRDGGGSALTVGLAEAPADATVMALGPIELIVDHYLLAHLPDPRAAIEAVARLLAPDGWAVIEFDHVLPTLVGLQVDAFRHGHRSYLSLEWLIGACDGCGLAVVDAAPQAVYGGALRAYIRPAAGAGSSTPTVDRVRAAERRAGVADPPALRRRAARMALERDRTLAALASSAASGRALAGYGAPARAVTLLNYYGLGPSLMSVTADASVAKQGRSIPGVRVPIVSPQAMLAGEPADILVLTWDLAAEVTRQLRGAGAAGARFHVPFPRLHDV